MIRTKENTKTTVVTGQVPPAYKGTVYARFTSQAFGPSQSGNPMITLEAEIIHPSTITSDYDGKTYDLTGQKLVFYLVLAEETAKGKPWDSLDYIVNSLLPLLGFPPELDDEHPLKSNDNPNGLDFEGKQFEVICATEQRKEMKRDKNDKMVPVTDQSGKEIIRGWQWKVGMKDILRPIVIETNKPF